MLKDAIYGFAIADALGVPFEFKERGSFQCVDMEEYGTWSQPKGTWSDDTSLTLATAASIKETKRIDTIDMLEKFRRWYKENAFTAHNELFDIGNTTREAIIKGQGKDDKYSNGNGSLMRILPLAFIDCSDEEIEKVSALTHAHSISKQACVIYVKIARELIKGRNIKEVLEQLEYEKPFNRLKHIDKLDESEIRSSGYVVDSLEAAIWCVVKSTSYKDCVLKAVNLGNDTDTIAAIAGGLAGIIYGYEAIPVSWINALANKELINKCLF